MCTSTDAPVLQHLKDDSVLSSSNYSTRPSDRYFKAIAAGNRSLPIITFPSLSLISYFSPDIRQHSMALFHAFFVPFNNNCPRLLRKIRQLPLYSQKIWRSHHVCVVLSSARKIRIPGRKRQFPDSFSF